MANVLDLVYRETGGDDVRHVRRSIHDARSDAARAARLPVVFEMHVEGLRHGMRELHVSLADLYRELGGTEL